MPNTKQAKKRKRQDDEKRAANRPKARAMRTAIRKVLRAENKAQADELLPEAMKRIDKAAKANIIHDNAAARYKARLARNVAGKA